MPTITYKPKYSIDTIISNFASKSPQTDLSTFISNNFDIGDTTIASTVNTTSPSITPIDINLTSTIMVDYGDGPVSQGLKQLLVIINNNVQTGTFTSGDIFGNNLLSGSGVDFSKVTDTTGSEIVATNLQIYTLLPYAPLDLQSSLNSTILNIVRDLRKGTYDYNNYLNVIGQARKLAQILVKRYA